MYLSSNRTISVKGHRVEGDSIILTLRNGGEVTCDKSLIEKIVSDEVPYPEPATPDAVSQPPRSGADLPEETPYGEIIAAMSEAHGVDPLLVRALIQVESNYKPRAKSPRGAMGLMQLMPSTAKEYNVRNPFDPRANIEAGIKRLKILIDRWGTRGRARGLQRRGGRRDEIQRDSSVPGDPELRHEDSGACGPEVTRNASGFLTSQPSGRFLCLT